MRNLKKVLSLALSLVMLLGMMVVGASAELTYKDADSITKKEAVEVMTALGILSGDEGGFRPTGTLKRSEAAKVLVYISDGSVVANALGQADTQFDDVPATHWASGFVAYCANLGIISGVDATHFNPDGELTSQEFAKMLLVAMGGDEANYVGSAWATNVRRDAIKAKINENADITLWDKAITRDQAAQMGLNALTKTLDGGKTVYVVGTVEFDNINDAAIYAALQKEEVKPKTDTTGTLGAKNYGLKQEVTVDKLGDKVTKWTANGKVEVIVDKSSDALITIAGEDYKAGTSGTLKGYTVDKDAECIYNGGKVADKDEAEWYTNMAGKRGVTLKFYGSDKTINKIVVEEPYFTEVKSVSKKGDVITLTVYEAGYIISNSGSPKTVTIKEGDDDYNLVKDMAKDDVFMGIFQPGWNNAKDRGLLVAIAGIPDTFEGKVTGTRIKTSGTPAIPSYNSSTVTVDGDVYKFANEYTRKDVALKDEGTFYVFNDYLYHFVATAAAGPDGYTRIIKATASNSGTGMYDESINMQVHAILSDGTVGVYKVAVKDGKAAGQAVTGTDWEKNFTGKVFTYTIDDDVMTLGETAKADKGSVATVTKYTGGTNNGSILFNSKTVYVVYKEDGKDTTAKMVTGVSALGKIDEADGQAVLGDNKVANIVFLAGTISPVSSGDYVYVDKDNTGVELVDDKDVITYTATTVEGEELVVYANSAVSASGVYSITEDNWIVGNVFGTGDKPTNYKAGTAKVTGELIQVGGTGAYYTITEDTNVVAIDGDADVDDFNGGKVMVVLDSDLATVETIFITAAPTPTTPAE